MVPQKLGVSRQKSFWRVVWLRCSSGRLPIGVSLLGLCLVIWSSVSRVTGETVCQDSLGRFLSQMYLNGSYCTCPAQHYEVVTETGRVRRHVQYTLPGMTPQPIGLLPDLTQVWVRLWGKIVDGPDGVYALSIQQHASGHDTDTLVRQVGNIRQGQEFEITRGSQDRIGLRTRTPYVLLVEGTNPNLRPQQLLKLQGHACFYLTSQS